MSSDEVEWAPAEHAPPAGGIEQSPRWGRRLEAWGWFALALGWLFVLSVPMAYLVSADETGDASRGPLFWTGVGFLLVVGLVLVVPGSWAVRRGRRHLQRILPDLRTDLPGERIVLFLRTFSDDVQFARTAGSRLLRWLLWLPPATPGDLRTEEEQIARGVAPFGRMVALGRPSERLPRSGAQRSYVSDAEWQAEVLACLERANLVLLVAGVGAGLRWEVEQAVGRDEPTRLVLVVMRDLRHYGDFRAAVGNLFPKGLPEDPGQRSSWTRHVRAVVWFEEDWTPHWQPLTGRFPTFRSQARTQYALPRALHEVFVRAGVRAPSKASSSLPRPRAVPAAVALYSAWVFLPTVLMNVTVSVFVIRFSLADPQSAIAMEVATFVFTVTYLVPWMWRVLRGGPIAFLLFQVCAVIPNFVPLVTLFVLLMTVRIDENDTGVVLVLIAGVNALVLVVVLPFVLGKLVFDRDVRAWLDSRT